MEFDRTIDLSKLLNLKSHFLFGPRGTGKSYAIRQQLKERAFVINLLDPDLFLLLSARPGELRTLIEEGLAAGKSLIVIDEVQRIPELLNEVHRLIEERKVRFLLTGSSARKLKRGQANLLAGRAWTASLFPLTSHEIPDFDLDRYLRFGGLPSVYPSTAPAQELKAYVHTYLYEEIQAEALVRKIPQFSRFLLTAALTNGELLNFSSVAADAQVAPATVREYYSILEDTLIGFMVPPWTKSRKRKAIQTAKFYFFDPGVTHAIAQTKSLDRNSNSYGKAFEQLIGMELRAYLAYRNRDESLCFWRSVSRQEVDFVVGDLLAIEVKASRTAHEHDLKNLKVLDEEGRIKKFILVTQDKINRKAGRFHYMHWKTFLADLWADRFMD